MNKRSVGTEYEARAAAYLESQGYRILERNYRTKIGEIDLIARDGAVLVFVEVKYRSGLNYGYPIEAVGPRKAATIRLVASQYLQTHGFYNQNKIMPICRFDVVSILKDQITLVKDAF